MQTKYISLESVSSLDHDQNKITGLRAREPEIDRMSLGSNGKVGRRNATYAWPVFAVLRGRQ
jgi:hypothetical protein